MIKSNQAGNLTAAARAFTGLRCVSTFGDNTDNSELVLVKAGLIRDLVWALLEYDRVTQGNNPIDGSESHG